ncbi:hypothetical protein SKAU_G00380220 [Synaphobranchus kaupii]|uniref:IF rod domain-containing protein n=1 Tax=Synaphobranchus kaupii TaxID=118154 RepID=A0A9Q1EDH5_SYNKA|nr:hypothetical protein SKAU_G00380220 [Synaphobranchus kaupii]
MAMMYGAAMQGSSSRSFAGSASTSQRVASSSSTAGFSGYSGAVGMAGRAGAVSLGVGGAGYAGGYGAGIGSAYGLASSVSGMGASYGASTIAGAGGIRAAQASSLGLGAGRVGSSGMVSSAYAAPSFGQPGGSFGVGLPGDLGYAPFAVNEKQLLHSLNDRLASYLEKVKHLEITNQALEEKLRAFTINKVQIRDLQVYEDQLVPLRLQLLTCMLDNSRTALELDNAKLTADDFRMKYETEYNLRESVEADIAGLKGLKTEYDFSNQALRQEFQLLTDELAHIRVLHEQDIVALRSEMAGTVTVDLQAGETINLAAVLQEMRSEYEAVVQQNRQEVETWYEKQLAMKQVVEQHASETTVSTSSEILESRKEWHSMQTELDSIRTSKMTLEENLLATESQFQVQVQRLNGMVVASENELAILRENALVQAQDYQNLLNIKMRLEMEIATYKQLLEGADMGALVVGGVVGGGVGVALATGIGTAAMIGGASMVQSAAMQSSSSSSASTSMQSSSSSVQQAGMQAAMMSGGAAAMQQSASSSQSSSSASQSSSESSQAQSASMQSGMMQVGGGMIQAGGVQQIGLMQGGIQQVGGDAVLMTGHI